MGAKVEWRLFAALGLALVSITFTDISPAGPWNDSTFTSGTIGLIGMLLLYLAWFRITFGIKGIVPTMDLWKDPEHTSALVVITGLVILGIAYAVGRIEFFPEPGGLVLSLVGLLVTTNGVYVWLSTAGPLKEQLDSQNDLVDEQEIEQEIEQAPSKGPDTVIYNIQNIEINDSVVMDTKFTTEEE
jgi:hypothetical protein